MSETVSSHAQATALRVLKAGLASIFIWVLLSAIGVTLDLITTGPVGPQLIEYASTKRLFLLDQSFRLLIATLTLLLGVNISKDTNPKIVIWLIVAVIVFMVVVMFLKKIYFFDVRDKDYYQVVGTTFWCWVAAQIFAVGIFVVSTFIAKKGS
jgi:hypothetical protein